MLIFRVYREFEPAHAAAASRASASTCAGASVELASFGAPVTISSVEGYEMDTIWAAEAAAAASAGSAAEKATLSTPAAPAFAEASQFVTATATITIAGTSPKVVPATDDAEAVADAAATEPMVAVA